VESRGYLSLKNGLIPQEAITFRSVIVDLPPVRHPHKPAQAGIYAVNAVSWSCTFPASTQEASVADEKFPTNPTPTPGSQPAGQTVRMVKCVKFGREMPGLDRIPWKGEIGKRVYENVSKEAWKLWLEHSKMIMNEYRLNPLDPNSQKIMEEQLEQFFFGEGAKLPEGYVPQKSKG
jgi:Fe-S cluster biosynthesis and repair protein YggX